MSEPSRSIPDVAEQLMHEFQSVFAVSTVTEVVIRLSRNGAVSLAALAEMARQELGTLAAAVDTRSEDLPATVAPLGG